ncbi:MAG: sigma-70 family RNA polymerase sigma factor [Pirellulaceae bacterium]|jgi:RNA polymerase sigma-70 factor (ECF subfamily)|nr:sigma-70 family RNA polymerase sigma factor [Pirellulaceae bacterium]
MSLSTDSSDTDRLLHRVAAGDRGAMELLMTRHREYLRQVIDARMEPRLRQKLDPSDVVQETLTVVSQRIDDYVARQPASFRLWLRSTAIEQLINARRRHRAQKRSFERDVRISDVSSLAIAKAFVAKGPSERMLRREVMGQVREALSELTEADRDILVMRHAEGLSNAEVAELLELAPKTASKRYGRALQRLAVQLAKLGYSRP